MGVELWTNNAETTLATGINNSVTTVVVATGDGALFPSISGSDYFYVTLDDGSAIEIVKCTARSTDTLTVTRGQQGTSGTAFSAGAAVELRLTKQAMVSLQAEANVTTAAYGSRPTAGVPGRIFLPSDGFQVERDTGTVWAPWGPLFPFTAPVDGDFSWVNQGSATVSTTNGGIYLSCVSNGAAQSARLRVKTLPSAPYTITVALLSLLHTTTYSIVLFGLRNSSDGKLVVFQIENTNTHVNIQLVKWDSETSPTGGVYLSQTGNMMPFPLTFLRFQDDNTNRILSWSADGQNFIAIHSVARTDFVTPNQALFGLNPFSQFTGVTLLSWKET